MRVEILALALAVGAANWAFRYGPLRLDLSRAAQGYGPLARFLAATGPAAIATLVVASVLPLAEGGQAALIPAAGGAIAVLALWFWRKSVVLATLGGAVAYAAVFGLMA